MRAFYLALIPLLVVASCATQSPIGPEAPYEPEPTCITTDLGTCLHWDKADFPILLVVDPNASLWRREIYVAVHYWNTTLSSQVFRIVDGVDTSEIVGPTGSLVPIRNGATEEGNPYTSVGYNRFTGEITGAPVYLPDYIMPRDRFRVIVHELGHVLGLAHDPGDTNSIMHPYVVNTGFTVRPEDVAFLKDRYFRE